MNRDFSNLLEELQYHNHRYDVALRQWEGNLGNLAPKVKAKVVKDLSHLAIMERTICSYLITMDLDVANDNSESPLSNEELSRHTHDVLNNYLNGGRERMVRKAYEIAARLYG